MKQLRFDQWLNRFFEHTEFPRDIIWHPYVLVFLGEQFGMRRSPAEAAQALRQEYQVG
jgi:hypothetical protein